MKDIRKLKEQYKKLGEEIEALEKEKRLPESWEELSIFEGYYVSTDSEVIFCRSAGADDFDENVFATREQAEASIAMAQLSQLMKAYNGEWVPNWTNFNKFKYCIYFESEELVHTVATTFRKFLAFKSQELRDHFLEHHRELIEKAKPLL